MLTSTLFIASLQALIAVVTAQTPAGFSPAVTQPLQVAYGANTISPAGEMVARPETAQPPTINVPANMVSPTAKGLLVMVDLDVPRNGQRVTNLHWLAPNVDISKAQAVVPNTADVPATYRQPSPPPGDTPHRYVYLMYAQPDGFTTPAQFKNLQATRLGFDVNAFAKAANLGPPQAANFIMVQQ